jgi:hypothetical protein
MCCRVCSKPKASDSVKCPSVVTEYVKGSDGLLTPRYYVRGRCASYVCLVWLKSVGLVLLDDLGD